MVHNIPKTTRKRVVIVGAGFGGLMLAEKLVKSNFQIVLVDKNNYHQFQPLFYQVATAFLEPSAIAFPLRKIFQKEKNILIRVTEVIGVLVEKQEIETTDMGTIPYDYLVIATGADTNYFGLTNIQANALPMKSVSEALALRNQILRNLEDAVTTTDAAQREALLNIAIVGGGPTGVEVAGTLAEMKRYILPKDYPETDFANMHIRLYENSPEVLGPMSENAQVNAKKYLEELGVEVMTGVGVADFDGEMLTARNGTTFQTRTLVWAAGVRGVAPTGFETTCFGRGNRLLVDEQCRVKGVENVFAIGDAAFAQHETAYPNGHPQVAPVAMQMGQLVAKNLKNNETNAFQYNNQGSMATVGRNKAVVDLGKLQFQGFFAWCVWMFVHLISIMGMKNRVLIFINWVWNYITFDQSLRLMMKPTAQK
jgi:NADH:ubiquinone reductase (H+-translocating)